MFMRYCREGAGIFLILAVMFFGHVPWTEAAPPALSVKSAAALEKVAGLYYEQANTYMAKLKEQDQRDSEALADEKIPRPLVAGGTVFDRRGQPIEAATVNVLDEKTGRILGSGLTGKDGIFSIALPTSSYRSLKLVVTKKDFANWERGAMYGGIVNFPARLDRDLHEMFRKKLAKEKDPVERFWLALEIVGNRNTELDVAAIFPDIGQIRPELLAITQYPLFLVKDQGILSPAGRARQLLTWWQDPADTELFDPSLISEPVPDGLTGADVEDVCKNWATHQTEKLGWKPAPDFSCSEPVYDVKKKRAMTTLKVKFVHWGYSQRLIFLNENKKWRLSFVMDHQRWQDR